MRIRRTQKTVTKEYPVHRQPGLSRLTCTYTDPLGSDQDVHIIYKLWQICIIPCRKRSSLELHGAIKKRIAQHSFPLSGLDQSHVSSTTFAKSTDNSSCPQAEVKVIRQS